MITVKNVKVTLIGKEGYTLAAQINGVSRHAWACSVLDNASGGGRTRVKKRIIQSSSLNDVGRTAELSLKREEKDWKRYEQTAKQANMTLHEWMRLVLDHAANVSQIVPQCEAVYKKPKVKKRR